MYKRAGSSTALRFALAVLLPLVLLVSACSSDNDNAKGSDGDNDIAVKIGIQNFNESKVLAHLYGEALDRNGFDVSYKELGGFRDILYGAFEKGDVNFTLEYASSTLEFLNEQAGQASPDIDTVMPLLREQLKAKKLTALDPSKAVDSNAFVVTSETAKAKNLKSMSDLTPDLRLGGFADCPTNPFCIPGIQTTYGVDLSKNFSPGDGGDLTKQALKGGAIDVAVLTTTDPDIITNNWVILTDDKGLINADNIVPVASDKLIADGGSAFEKLINSISAKLDTKALTELNRQFVVDKEDAEDIAEKWLDANGF